MGVIHGGLLEIHNIIIEALGIISLFIIVKTWHKTHAFVPVALVIVLAGLVWFAANNSSFIGGTVCDAVKTAAQTGGATAPSC